MSDKTLESDAVDKTTDAPAPGEETKTDDTKLEDGEANASQVDESKEEEESGIDYKAALAKAEAKIVKLKKTAKAPAPKVVEEVEDVEDVDDRVAAAVKEAVAGVETKLRGQIVASEVDDILAEVSSNPDEQALIKHIYENRMQKGGFHPSRDSRRSH